MLGFSCFARTHINGGLYEGDLSSSLKKGGLKLKHVCKMDEPCISALKNSATCPFCVFCLNLYIIVLVFLFI